MSDRKHTAVAVIERAPVPERLHPMVKAAMAQAPDPATLRELLALQREWEAGEAKREYTRAMVALKSSLPSVIVHDAKVNFAQTRFSYASIGEIIERVTPHLTAHGFSASWVTSTAGDDVTVVCRLTHSGGHSEDGKPLTAKPDTKKGMNDVQAKMSTATTLQRYSLMQALGIASADQVESGTTETPAPDAINSARNLKAAGALKKYGKTREEAEAKIGRPVSEWTASDLDTLAAWLKPKASAPAEDPHVVNAAKEAREHFEHNTEETED